MKITKDKLRQIVKEELTVLKQKQFSRDAKKIKERLMEVWEENNRRTTETFESPDEITAEVLKEKDYTTRYEWEDLSEIIQHAVKAYNHDEESPPVSIDLDAVEHLLYREG